MNKKLMTALLNDGSQITGEEVSSTIHGDEVVLSCDGCEVEINMLFCIAYYEETDPVIDAPVSAELPEFLKHQAI